MNNFLSQIYKLKELINNLEKDFSKDNKSVDFNFSRKELKSMPRLKEFNIRIKNGKYYEIRYRKHGYNVSFSSKDFKTAKQKAFTWLSAFESQIKANVNFCIVKQEDITFNKKVIFKTFADEYIYGIKKRKVKSTTFASYESCYKKNILPIYGKMPLSEIAPAFIQKHLDKVNEKTPRLCEDVKTLLNNVFDYAVSNGVIERNPIKAVYIPKHERQNGKALTPEQERNFIAGIKGTYYEKAFLKMLYAGVRPCEVNEVTENIEDNTLTIKNGKLKAYQKNFHRVIPIFPKYQERLTACENKKVYIDELRRVFKQFCPDNSLKDLRHTFTTRARECGIDNELVAVWTGHSLGNITASVYTHFSNEFQQAQAKRLIY